MLKRTFKHLWQGMTAAVLLGVLVVAGAVWNFLQSHPHSVVQAEPVNRVTFIWSGAVTAHSARVNAKFAQDGNTILLVSRASDLSEPIRIKPSAGKSAPVLSFSVTGLSPDTRYYYAIEIDGALDRTRSGRFRTFPEGAFSFRIALSSCAETGSNHAVFDTIRREDPLFFLHLGDFHYEDIVKNDRALYRRAFDTVLTSPAQSALYRHVPLVYIWDDHDFGPNDAYGADLGGSAARLTYREYVPHYPLAVGDGDLPIYHAFSVGRVRFILTDLRSERTLSTGPDDVAQTMLGARQKRWFKEELRRANGAYPLIVWVNTVPWIGLGPMGDHWGGYTTERRELANYFAAIDLRGLVIVSGDAHMLAIDDGTNADYADRGGPKIPVLQAGALDSIPILKGGPYSEGKYAGSGQYALMTGEDNGEGPLHVSWSGRDSTNREIVSLHFDMPDR